MSDEVYCGYCSPEYQSYCGAYGACMLPALSDEQARAAHLQALREIAQEVAYPAEVPLTWNAHPSIGGLWYVAKADCNRNLTLSQKQTFIQGFVEGSLAYHPSSSVYFVLRDSSLIAYFKAWKDNISTHSEVIDIRTQQGAYTLHNQSHKDRYTDPRGDIFAFEDDLFAPGTYDPAEAMQRIIQVNRDLPYGSPSNLILITTSTFMHGMH